ncbi:hypothetical protein QAD02_023525, partial [Eretmocerus hayati]
YFVASDAIVSRNKMKAVEMIRESNLLLYIFTFIVASYAWLESGPVVLTNSGPVRGTILTTVRKSVKFSSFTGIPFAKPPLGPLRFQAPVPIDNWEDELDATQSPSSCAQPNIIYFAPTTHMAGSEDCLYLNVYSPRTEFNNLKKADLRAVLIWIFPGAFVIGDQISSLMKPDFLLEEDVVVASMNYRLGAFGFLNLNHKNASGNAGLKDQALALEWLKKNIQRFGGDPERITIFGQSAGGASVDFHTFSDMSGGLFQQTLSISGSPLGAYWSLQTNKDALKQAFILGSRLGYESNDVEGLLQTLSSAPASEIVFKSVDFPGQPFRPTVERVSNPQSIGTFLSSSALNRYISGDHLHKGRHMIGFTELEAKVWHVYADWAAGLFNETQKQFKAAGVPIDLSSRIEFIKSMKGQTSTTLESVKGELEDLLQFTSDLFFVAGIDQKVRYLTSHEGHPVYYYRFAFQGQKYVNGPSAFDLLNYFNVTGTTHTEDLLYLFYVPVSGIPIFQTQISRTIDRYVKLITNFAKYGNPTPEDRKDELLNITWPQAGTEGLHLEINEELSVGPRPITDQIRSIQKAGAVSSPILWDC